MKELKRRKKERKREREKERMKELKKKREKKRKNEKEREKERTKTKKNYICLLLQRTNVRKRNAGEFYSIYKLPLSFQLVS